MFSHISNNSSIIYSYEFYIFFFFTQGLCGWQINAQSIFCFALNFLERGVNLKGFHCDLSLIKLPYVHTTILCSCLVNLSLVFCTMHDAHTKLKCTSFEEMPQYKSFMKGFLNQYHNMLKMRKAFLKANTKEIFTYPTELHFICIYPCILLYEKGSFFQTYIAIFSSLHVLKL